MNTDYFNNDSTQKIKWLSIFIQCSLYNLKDNEEVDSHKLFIRANSAWYKKTGGTLSEMEFMPVLNFVINQKMVFNLSMSSLEKYKLASQQLKLAMSDLLDTPVLELLEELWEKPA
jgi:hypothetical protein